MTELLPGLLIAIGQQAAAAAGQLAQQVTTVLPTDRAAVAAVMLAVLPEQRSASAATGITAVSVPGGRPHDPVTAEEQRLQPGFDSGYYTAPGSSMLRRGASHTGRQLWRRALLAYLRTSPCPLRDALRVALDHLPARSDSALYVLADLGDEFAQAVLFDLVHLVGAAVADRQRAPTALLYLGLPEETAPAEVRAGAFATLREVDRLLAPGGDPQWVYPIDALPLLPAPADRPVDLTRLFTLLHIYPPLPQRSALWADALLPQWLTRGAAASRLEQQRGFSEDYFGHHVTNWRGRQTPELAAALRARPGSQIVNVIVPRTLVLPAAHLRRQLAAQISRAALRPILDPAGPPAPAVRHMAEQALYRLLAPLQPLLDQPNQVQRFSAERLWALLFPQPTTALQQAINDQTTALHWQPATAVDDHSRASVETSVLRILSAEYGYGPLRAPARRGHAERIAALVTIAAADDRQHLLELTARLLDIQPDALDRGQAYPHLLEHRLRETLPMLQQAAESAAKQSSLIQQQMQRLQDQVYQKFSAILHTRRLWKRTPELIEFLDAADHFVERQRAADYLAGLHSRLLAQHALITQLLTGLRRALDELAVLDQHMQQQTAAALPPAAPHQQWLVDDAAEQAWAAARPTLIAQLSDCIRWQIADHTRQIALASATPAAGRPLAERWLTTAAALVSDLPISLWEHYLAPAPTHQQRQRAVIEHLAITPTAAFPNWQWVGDWLITPYHVNAYQEYAAYAADIQRINRLPHQLRQDENGADPLRITRVVVGIGAVEHLPAYTSAQRAYREQPTRPRLHLFRAEQIALDYETELEREGETTLLPPRIIALLEQPAALTLFAQAYAADRIVERTAISSSGRPDWRNFALLHTASSHDEMLVWLTERHEEGAERRPASLLEAARAFCLHLEQRRQYGDPVQSADHALLTLANVQTELTAWITSEADRSAAGQPVGTHWQDVRRIQRNRAAAQAAAAWIDRLSATAAALNSAAAQPGLPAEEELFRRVLALHCRRYVNELRLSLRRNFV